MAISPVQRARTLERRITALAAERGTTAARLRRLVGFSVLCETMAEAVTQGVVPFFFVKGGVAIELRLGLAARATRDLDIGLCAPAEELLPAFDASLSLGFGDFRFRRRGEARALNNGARSLQVTIEYVGRPFATIDVDLAQATTDVRTDTVEPISLHELGLMRPRAIPCLSLTEQIAQKIHALTDPMPRGRVNMRSRDAIDVLLLDARLSLDTEAITQACVILFAQRATHEWPILHFSFPSEWNEILTELVRQVNYDTTDVSVVEKRFNAFLARLNG
jgi:hypothetical protein